MNKAGPFDCWKCGRSWMRLASRILMARGKHFCGGAPFRWHSPRICGSVFCIWEMCHSCQLSFGSVPGTVCHASETFAYASLRKEEGRDRRGSIESVACVVLLTTLDTGFRWYDGSRAKVSALRVTRRGKDSRSLEWMIHRGRWAGKPVMSRVVRPGGLWIIAR